MRRIPQDRAMTLVGSPSVIMPTEMMITKGRGFEKLENKFSNNRKTFYLKLDQHKE